MAERPEGCGGREIEPPRRSSQQRSRRFRRRALNEEPSFGAIVEERRHFRDLTESELARRVGCATITIRKIDADTLRPSVQIAERLAMALARSRATRSLTEEECQQYLHLDSCPPRP